MAIDIGAAAIIRGSFDLANYTVIEESNPANADGTITSVEIYCTISNILNCEVATFEEVSSNTFTTRDSETLGTVINGSKQTFSGLDMDVETGDYIGTYFSDGYIYYASSGGTGIWYVSGTDHIPCTSQAFSHLSSYIISLYGTGEEVAAGWSHKFLGVANASIGKICGVAIANIKKVNGV